MDAVAALHLLLVYLAAAALCLWLVHRFVRELSTAAALWLTLLPLALPGAALVQGKVYAPMDLLYEHPPWSDVAAERGLEARPSYAGDLPFQIVPWHKAVRDAWAAGDWPLWNPYMLSGDLLAASAQPAPYHPLNLVSLLLPLDLSLTFQAAAMLFLAALGGFLWCRELDCGDAASLVGAAAWTFSGFLVFWLLWPMAAAVATMPWVAAGIRRLPRIGLLTTALTLLLLSGHPESMLHVVATGCLYGLFEIARRVLSEEDRKQRLRLATRVVGSATLAGVLAGGLAAIHLLPIVDALPETAMYELRRSQFAHQDHSVPWIIARERMMTAVLPFRFGISWTPERLAAPGFYVPMSSAYVGTVALGLALLGFWRGRRRGGLRWFLAAWAAVGVAAGAGAPGVTHAMAALPLFDLSIHRRWVFAAAWALATLAALGADAWLRRERTTPGAARRDLALCLLAAAAVAGAALWENWAEMRRPFGAEGLDAAFLVHHGLLLLLPPLVAAGGLLVTESRASARFPARRLVWALLALLVAQRAAESWNRFPSLERADAFPAVPLLEKIPRGEMPERTVGVGFTFLANTSAYYGLEDVRGYQPMSSRIYTETFPLWDSSPRIFFNEVERLDSPFLDFLGVRWAVAPADHEPEAGWRTVAATETAQLLENADALPRAFLPEELVFDVPHVMFRLHRLDDFRRRAYVDTPAPDHADDGPGRGAVANAAGRVETVRDGTGLRLEADLEAPGWVVVSQPHWRGWRAERVAPDGQRESLPVHTANHAFLALELPAGRSEVDLFFSPTSFRLGRALSFGTLFLLAVVLLARLRNRRSAPA